jgi:DNA-binding NarL/FixJ family response regulator
MLSAQDTGARPPPRLLPPDLEAASVRVLVADQHQAFRERVRQLLDSRPGFEVCAEAATGQELVDRANECSPDLILTEFALPVINGFEAAELIRQFQPHVLILFVSLHQNGQIISDAKAAGINGYVQKMDVAETLLTAIDAIEKGRPFFPDPK